jgi:hypothetical protein
MPENMTRGPDLPLETPLWRYMDVSRLMSLLVCQKVFIPTLATLRKDHDPEEALLPSYCGWPVSENLFDDSREGVEAWDWIAKRIEARLSPQDVPDTDVRMEPLRTRWNDAYEKNHVAFEEWLDELSCRRAVWCWASPEDPECRKESYESLAMWNSYARAGIAIKTTLGNIENAIRTSSDLKGSKCHAMRVEYRRQGYAMSELFERDRLKRPFRPYSYKNRSYDYEHEVRIVFRVDGARRLPGVVVRLDPLRLLQDGEVVVSPYLGEPEADHLVELVKKLLGDGHASSITVRRSSERQSPEQESLSRHNKSIAKMPALGPFEDEPEVPELLREL